MLVSSNRIETNKYELQIKVSGEKFAEAISNAYRQNIKKINVPGFRKGKAPMKMVEKLYGEGVFFEDAINALYPSELSDAITEAKLEVVARPDVEIIDVDKAEGFNFKAVCVVKPEVEVKDYKGIKVAKTVKAVTDEEVDAEIAKLQEKNSRMVSVTGRAAQLNDVATIDFDGYVDGVAFDGGKAEKFSLTLGSGQFIPGFEEQVIGKNIDDEFDVNVTFPEEYHEASLAGKPTVFKVKLHELKAKELATVDDEFAKDVSEFDTVDELKADITKKIQEQYDKNAETEIENQLIDNVIENMTAEIPEVMFTNRVDDSVQDFEHKLSSQGMKLDMYLQYTGMDMDSFRKTFEEQAQKQVKIRLALEKIVELEAITASEEELNAEYEKLAENYKMPVEDIEKFIPHQDFTKDICVNKAIDLIKNSAEITEKKETAKKATKATTEEKPAAKKTAAKKTAAKKQLQKSTC
jgi:trigger factor